MALYKRDYLDLTEEEVLLWNALKEQEKKGDGFLGRISLFRQYPRAARHYSSLFPNNYLDIVELKDEKELHEVAERFLVEINNPNVTENTILKFIKENEAYFIIGALLKDYNFGHHEAYIIPEFCLGNTYRVDYLIIGKNSGGYEFVLVELEHPIKDIVLKDGELGAAFRKGIKQINDWKRYVEANFPTLEETFLKHKSSLLELPREFMKLDKTRIHYAVIAGKRTDFNDNTYWHQRNLREREKINIRHYDNLYDFAKSVIGESTY